MSVQDATSSHTCREPGCTKEAKSDRGLYSRCDAHRAARAQNGGARGGGLVAKLEGLKTLARRADAAEAKAKKLTTLALKAKQEADVLRGQLAEEMRAIGEAS